MQPINVNSQNAIPFIFVYASTISLVIAILTLLPDGILCPTVSWTVLGISSACLIIAVLLSPRSKKLIVSQPNEIISSQPNLPTKTCHLTDLPTDITLQICNFLSFSDLSSLRCVNKLFTQDRFCIPLAKALGFANTNNVTEAQNNIRIFNSYIPLFTKIINSSFYKPYRKHQNIVQEVLSWQTRSSKEIIDIFEFASNSTKDLCQIIPFLLNGRKPELNLDERTLDIANSSLYIAINRNEKDFLSLFSLLVGCGVIFTSLPSHHDFLAIAARNRKLEVCTVLLSHGASINHCSEFGTALHYAVLGRDPSVVEFFLINGANPNILNPYNGYTPLMTAVEKGKKELVKILLNAESDVNVRGLHNIRFRGETAFSLSRKYPEIRQMLIDAGVPPTTNMWGD